MAKPGRKRYNAQRSAQWYDTTFKDWIRKEARDVLPLFIPGATYEETLDVEIVRPTMRADKVFKGKYQGEDSIFNVEFESGSDTYILSRLLTYNAVLYKDHHLPVISMIVYPFRTTVAQTPLVINSGKKNIITFHFERLPLFLEEAEHYVREHITFMYPLLPTMQGTNSVMMKQIMDELAALYRDDEVTLAQQFVWMELLLERTETIAPSEKEEIQKELKMYDPLWEEHPKVKKIRVESRTEGEVQALRSAIVTVVKVRFPALGEMAQNKVEQINTPEVLKFLLAQISAEPEEIGVRSLLRPTAA
ncbi:MAG: hypothetical protein E6I91_02890 [Chloroflexi bacterium]|nr:MAG: hypothetical protein E6I91_02890 [Chloroflexota bacterium]